MHKGFINKRGICVLLVCIVLAVSVAIGNAATEKNAYTSMEEIERDFQAAFQDDDADLSATSKIITDSNISELGNYAEYQSGAYTSLADYLYSFDTEGAIYRDKDAGTKRSARNGFLYYNTPMDNFTLEMEYQHNIVQKGWQTMYVGFGAQQVGANAYTDEHATHIRIQPKEMYVQHQEITVGFGTTSGVKAFKAKHEAAQTEGNPVWYTLKLEVNDGVATWWIDGYKFTQDLAEYDYEKGLLYIGAAREGTAFRNIKVTCNDTEPEWDCLYDSMEDIERTFRAAFQDDDAELSATSKIITDSNISELGNYAEYQSGAYTSLADYLYSFDTEGAIYRDKDAGTKRSARNGFLYYNTPMENFTLEMEYQHNIEQKGWQTMYVGFGAQQVGSNAYTDEHATHIRIQPKEMYVQHQGLVNVGLSNTAGYKTLIEKHEAAQTAGEPVWYKFKLVVNDGVATWWIDDYKFSQDLSNYNYTGGMLYIGAARENTAFRNIRLSIINDYRPMPVLTEQTFYNMSQVEKIEQGDKTFTIWLDVNSEQVPLYVSLPTEGGIRICTTEQGVFKPDEEENLEYTKDVNGNVKVVAKDNSYFTFKQLDDNWELEIGQSDESKLVLNGSDLYLGYDNGKVAGIKFIAPLDKNEAIYGTGERYNAVNQVGTTLQLWNLDTGYHGADDVMETKTESYNNIPFIHSTKGYSLFLNSTYCIDADFGVEDASRYELKAYGPKFDFYFWTGTPSENIASYTDLTGRVVQLPKWAYSYWAGSDANVWKGSDNGESEYISIVQEYLDGYKELGVDLVALYGETPITTDQIVYNKLKENNTRMLMWNPCYMSLDKILDSLNVVGNAAPIVYSSIAPGAASNLGANNTYIDYSHPNAKQLVKKQYEQYVEWGLRGLMVDMGERIPYDTVFYNGLTGDEMHNFYAYYYAKTINEAFTEMLNGENDFVLFERSGCAGIQSYAASFTGDQVSRMSGLKQQLNAGLSMSTSGCTIWGGDIGGYGGTPTEDTYIRWIQFATFEPLMREHGNSQDGNAPWFFGEDAEDVFKRFYWLRENMVDTIYSAALNSSKYGTLITTPLMVAYPEQTELHSVEDEYLFCDNLLVCPVTEEEVTSREVTLPEGTWYDLWTGTAVAGGQTINAYAPQSTIPVYWKSGALMAMKMAESFELGQPIDSNTAKKVLVVTPPETNTKYEIWDDEGETSVVYRNTLKSDNVYTISVDGEAVEHILAYGTLAESVKVDEMYLPKISKEDTGSYGYYIDEYNRTVIILPDGNWNDVEITRDGIYDAYYATDNTIDVKELTTEQMVKTDFENCWTVEETAEGKVFTRTGEGIYQAPNKQSKGSSLLYFGKQPYAEFDMTFEYAINNDSGYKWVSVGFGADTPGSSFLADDGYMINIEREGRISYFYPDGTTNNTSSYINSGINQTYIDSQTEDITMWHTVNITVGNGKVKISYDGGNVYTQEITDYAGYIYLCCSTDGMQFRNINIKPITLNLYGDADKNGKLDIVDLVRIKKASEGLAVSNSQCDLNEDTEIDGIDISIIKRILLNITDFY